MNVSNIDIHIKSEHSCGRMLETILHVKEPNLEGYLNTQFPKLGLAKDEELTPHFEPETENHLELTGSLDGIVFTTCICHLSIRARMRQWLVRLLARYRSKEQEP